MKRIFTPITRRKYSLLTAWILLTIILGVLSVTMFNQIYDIQSPIVRKPQPIVSPLAEPKKTTLIPHIEKAYAETPKPITKTALQAKVLAYFPEEEHEAVIELLHRESTWNPQAINSSSGACGLFQSLPCSKMGCDDLSNINCQALWGSAYIESRYGTAQKAIAFHNINNWY